MLLFDRLYGTISNHGTFGGTTIEGSRFYDCVVIFSVITHIDKMLIVSSFHVKRYH